MPRHDTKKIPSPEHFKDYLLKKHNLKSIISNNKILISGKPRGSRKTTTVFDYLIDHCKSFLEGKNQPSVVYVTRAIGTVEPKNNVGTFYDTEGTIRRLEKKSPLYRENELKICMVSGLGKSCSKYQSIANEYRKRILCKECEFSRKIGGDDEHLEEKLKQIPTLTPYLTKQLSEEYCVCTRAIIDYYVMNVANIVLMTYAMLPHWNFVEGPINPEQSVFIYDEARHLIEQDNVDLLTLKKEKQKEPSVEDFRLKIEERLVPDIDVDDNDKQEWYSDDIDGFVSNFSLFLNQKISALFRLEKERGFYTFKNEFEEEEFKSQNEMFSPVQVLPFVGVIDFPDEIFKKNPTWKVSDWIDNLAEIYMGGHIPDTEIMQFKKVYDLLNIMESFSGCEIVEIELLKSPAIKSKFDEYTLSLKPYKKVPIQTGFFVFFIDATPFDNRYYKYWLTKPISDVTLNDDTPVTIVYENAKRSTKEIYGHGLESEPLERHISQIKSIIELCNKAGFKYSIVARTKEVKSILELKGVQVDMACGDIQAEGVQIDADVLILEGTQIRNIGVDRSRKYTLGRVLKTRPSQAFQEYLDVVNAQQLIQTSFRSIDGRGKKKNIIIMLGNRMPHRDLCWVEFAKERWSWMERTNLIKVDGMNIENRLKSIDMIFSEKKTESKLTPYEEQIYQYIKSRNYGRVKKSTCVKYFQKPKTKKIMKKTNSAIYSAIKRLVDLGYVKLEDGILQIKK